MIYETIIKSLHCSIFKILELKLTTPWYRFREWFTFSPQECAFDHCNEDIEIAMSEFIFRASELRSTLEYFIHQLPSLDTDQLKGKVLAAKNEDAKRNIFEFHFRLMVDAHLEGNKENSIFHGQLAWTYNPKPNQSPVANNLGYVFLSNGETEIASELLVTAIELGTSSEEISIAKYNYGLVFASRSDWDSALGIWEEAKNEAEKLNDDERVCLCLLIPEISDDYVRLCEIFDPDLLVTINHAIELVKLAINPA